MINHARTLLLNLDGGGTGFLSDIGEEFIPPTFRAITFPGFLQQVHAVLFGGNPDRVMFNFRARQYLGILHHTELEEFVLELDNRITYDVLPTDDLFNNDFAPRITKLEGTTSEIFLIDEVGPPDQSGRTRHSWRILIVDSDIVRVTRQTPPIQISDQTYTLTQNLSSLFQLVGSGLQARFGAGVGSEWLITAIARPEEEISTITTNLESVGGDVLDNLFGVGSSKGTTEPFLTFRNLWKKHPEAPYRLGGILLAWIFQADEIWKVTKDVT